MTLLQHERKGAFAAQVAGTAPVDLHAYAVGWAHGAVSTAIRYLQQGHADWALQELRGAMPHLDAAIAPGLPTHDRKGAEL